MRRQALAKELRKMLQAKPRTGSTLKHDALFEEIRAQSQVVGSQKYLHGNHMCAHN